jgi:hypothetical protein
MALAFLQRGGGFERFHFALVLKVGAALWERVREAKLRFGGGRESRGIAFDVGMRRRGDGVSPG